MKELILGGARSRIECHKADLPAHWALIEIVEATCLLILCFF